MLLQIVLDYYGRRGTQIQNSRLRKLIVVSEAYVNFFGSDSDQGERRPANTPLSLSGFLKFYSFFWWFSIIRRYESDQQTRQEDQQTR